MLFVITWECTLSAYQVCSEARRCHPSGLARPSSASPRAWCNRGVLVRQRDTRARRLGAGGRAVPSGSVQVHTVTSTQWQGPHRALLRTHLRAPGRGAVLLVGSIRGDRNARDGDHGFQTWKKSTINKSAPPSEGPLSVSFRRSTRMRPRVSLCRTIRFLLVLLYSSQTQRYLCKGLCVIGRINTMELSYQISS